MLNWIACNNELKKEKGEFTGDISIAVGVQIRARTDLSLASYLLL
jgi:hypothetical protein